MFVHHNTLGAVEDMPFHAALERAADELGARVRLEEDELREMLADGRIALHDLRAVFEAESAPWIRSAAHGLPPAREIAWQVLVDGLSDVHWRIRAFEVSVGRPDQAIRTLDLERRALLAEGARRVLARDPAGAVAILTGTEDPEVAHRRLRQQLGLQSVEEVVRAGMEQDSRAEELGLALLAGLARRGLPPREATEAGEGHEAIERAVDKLLLPLLATRLDRGTLAMRPEGSGLFVDGLRLLRGRRRVYRHVEALVGDTAELTLSRALAHLDPDGADPEGVLRRLLLARPGWAGAVVWREHHRGDMALVDYAALRLLAWIGCARDRGLPRAELLAAPPPVVLGPGTRADRVAQVLARIRVGPDQAGALTAEAWAWLEALVEAADARWRCRLLQDARDRSAARGWISAVARARPAPVSAPRVQVLCCIDDREESLRRALEELGGPEVETLGVAGFFNLALAFRRAGEVHAEPSHPVSMASSHEIVERGPAPGLSRRALGRLGWETDRGGLGLLAGAGAALLFGLIAPAVAAWRVFAPLASARWLEELSSRWAPIVAEPLDPWAAADRPAAALAAGFTVDEAAARVVGALAPLGLAGRVAPIVVVVGHGSSSLNNPHESAHDCGACGGHRGDPNARVFAALANRPEVRAAAAGLGLEIPASTIFVAGYHDTASDQVRLWWPSALDEADRGALRSLFDAASARDARERGRRFFALDGGLGDPAAWAHARGRATDLSQVRPEYGHATNALLIVGPRARTRGLFLDRRAFLQSYEPDADPDGAALTGLLAATIPVCAGINLEYYFSRVDNERFGAGTKIPHNVIGLHGVMNGSWGDLRTGLPWQMVEIHEPTRLLVLVCAPRERVSAALQRIAGAARLVAGAWIHLAVVDEEGAWVFRDGRWVAESVDDAPLPEVEGSVAWFASRRDALGAAQVGR
ncbi:MAG: DUF2309 family protein [Alphaproteobacteria bacterium]|nr:DUF2309 family protein [Alphaproteobacteria bacterium]